MRRRIVVLAIVLTFVAVSSAASRIIRVVRNQAFEESQLQWQPQAEAGGVPRALDANV